MWRKYLRHAQGTSEILARGRCFNPVGASEFPRRRPREKALRRASGVWSLGGAGLFPEWCNVPGKVLSGGDEKGSTPAGTNLPGIRTLKRGLAAGVSAREGGVVLQISPVIGDLAA
jgi:hypothetical protein